MTEETTQESAVAEPVVEPTPVPEPVVEVASVPESTLENGSNGNERVEEVKVDETLQPSLEATADTATAQPVEPLNSEPVFEPTPEPITEPVSVSEPAPSSQTQTSTPAITGSSPTLARQLLTKARLVIQIGKRKKLERIMSLFLKKAEITNDDVQKHLYVSDATATRYLDQLESERKIRRVNVGKYSSYSRM